MNTLTDWTLTNLATNGVPLLLFVSYIGSLGIPFPITIVIIAAGAFTRTGLLDWRLAVLACLIGSALADNSEYLLGRIAQQGLKRRFGQKMVWLQAQSTIDQVQIVETRPISREVNWVVETIIKREQRPEVEVASENGG